ncbi:MAG: hypothetical protein ACRCTI_16470, partial [Beijerinckiaceae bacterium]
MNILNTLVVKQLAGAVIPLAARLWTWFDRTLTGLLSRLSASRVGRFLRALARLLWVCRIAVGSVLVGWLLLQAPQARDLFLDLSHDPRGIDQQTSVTGSMVLHGLKVLYSVVIFWVMPVYISALWCVENWKDWSWPDPKDRDDAVALKMMLWVPAVLGLVPFILLIHAVLRTETQLFQPDLHPWSGVAAHQLLVHLILLSAGAIAFVALIYGIYRWSLGVPDGEENRPTGGPLMQRLSFDLKQHWERVLFSLFALVLAMTTAAVWNPSMGSTGARLLLIAPLLGGWVPVLHLLSYFSIKSRVPLTALTAGVFVFLGASSSERHPVRLYDPTVGDSARNIRYDMPAAGLVPARYQIELLEGVLLWMKAQDPPCGDRDEIARLLADKDARARFMASGANLAGADRCPNPIVVAAAGGASRAAFQTVTVLGHLLDITCVDGGQPRMTFDTMRRTMLMSENGKPAELGGCPRTPEFANRLFAISGVSGGAFGAAVYAAAWANALPATDLANPSLRLSPLAKRPIHQQPCRTDSVSQYAEWFGNERPEIMPTRPVVKTWRDCMQAIVAGDFLSPVVHGLAFRDQRPFGTHLEGDRAAQLENVWIDRFAELMHERTRTKVQHMIADDPFGMDVEVERHGHRLSNSFAAFLPSGENWRPLLLMNGTSATSGRRLITSHLEPHLESADPHRLFPEALDLREVVNTRKLRGGLDLTRRCQTLFPALSLGSVTSNNWDVSLATSATNSARFPLVSPPGTLGCSYPSRFNIGYRADVFDKVIDGGYFENYGQQTAIDVVQALEERPFGLRPLVIVISNEPMTTREWRALMTADTRPPPAPDAAEVSWFDWLMTPGRGL